MSGSAHGVTPVAPEVVMRESDLQVLRTFFEKVLPVRCLVISPTRTPNSGFGHGHNFVAGSTMLNLRFILHDPRGLLDPGPRGGDASPPLGAGVHEVA